jgi:quercetin dioxygenase-like cupin family protein
MAPSTTLKPFASNQTLERSLSYVGGTLLTILATAEETGGQFALVRAYGRKGAGPPPHTHRYEDETFYVLEGEGTYYVGGEQIKAVPGTSIFLPRGIEHWFTIDSDEAKVLNLITPGGFEGYFTEMSEPAQALTLPPPPSGPPDIAKLIAVSAKYGVAVKAPPR